MKKFIALTLVVVCACCFSLGCKKPATDVAAPADAATEAPADAPADAAAPAEAPAN